MYHPRFYLALFVAYLLYSAFVLYIVLTGKAVGNTASFLHMLTTIVYAGYVLLYRRHRVAEGLPTKGLALFR